jgi:phosphopantetheinyl transferase (holo-ACP synthase)
MQIVRDFQNKIENKDYSEALMVLIKNKEAFDPAVYEYNLATVWARKEKFVESRIHFEKAIKLGLINKELVKNLEMVKDQLGVGYLEQKNSFEENFLDFSMNIDIYTPILISSILLIAFMMWVKNFLNIFSVVISLLISLLPIAGYVYLQDNYVVSIVREDTIVREGPSKIFPETQVLPAGMKFISKKTGKDWYSVVVPKSHQGWVLNPEMEKL